MKTVLRHFAKSRRTHRRIALAVLACNLFGCVNLADTRLARQDLLDSPEGNQVLALKDLHFLADKGYADAQIVLAEYFARIGKPKHIDETDALFQRMIHVSYLYNKRYSNWLFNVAKVTPSYREKALDNLWQRMKTQGDVGPQIARLEQIYEDDVTPIVDELFAYIDAQEGLYDTDKVKIIAELDDLSPWMEQVNEICSSSTSVTFYCLKSKVRYAKQNDNQQLNTLAQQANDAYVQGLMSKTEVVNLMKLFATQNDKVGFGSRELAYQSAEMAIQRDPEVFLEYANYEIGQAAVFANADYINKLQTLEDDYPIAGVLLGRVYMEGRRSVEYPQQAKSHLEAALPTPEASYYLGKLLLSGKLGKAELQDGVQHMVDAARKGQYRAYRELLQLFSYGNGIKPNALYANVFAKVYQELGFELSDSDHLLLEGHQLAQEQKQRLTIMVEEELNAIVPVSETF